MNKLDFMLLQKEDSDTSVLKKLHKHPSVKKFISIGKNYFKYVTESENVFYYKILFENNIIGGIHSEINGSKMYISVFISPDFRNRGYGKESVKYVINNFKDKVDTIEVAIDENNLPSIRLFESLGFEFTEKDGKLNTYRLAVK